MRAGRLDRRIVIQKNTPIQDALGESTDAWAEVATVWAERNDSRGREFFGSDQVTGEAVTMYRIRFRSDVVAAMRILDGAEVWDIQSVAGGFRRKEFIEIVAVRLGA